ncbi:MAG: helix-turn-helix domain-containing protein [Pseudomonadota bacterium]
MTRESVDQPEQKLLGHALRVLRKRQNVRAEDAAERFGIGVEGWRKYERGEAKAIFAPDTQRRLAWALGAQPGELLAERARLAGEDVPAAPRVTPAERASWAQSRSPGAAELLPIRDTVQAGAWLMADDARQDAALYPAVRDPRFPQAHQWMSEVRGDSMNQLAIVEGDLVHCVDAVDIGYYPRTGDVVEVERLRFDGQERELTLKQVEVTPEGAILLWPRSSNPRWREPIEIAAGLREGEEVEVRVRALVLASVRRF